MGSKVKIGTFVMILVHNDITTLKKISKAIDQLLELNCALSYIVIYIFIYKNKRKLKS